EAPVVKLKPDEPQPSAAGPGATEASKPVQAHSATVEEDDESANGKPAAHHRPMHVAKPAGGKTRTPAVDDPPAEDKHESVPQAQAQVTSPPPQRQGPDAERVRPEALLRRAPPFASLAA